MASAWLERRPTRSAFNRARRLHGQRLDAITPADIAELVGELHAAGQARETIRKTVTVLSMIFDHAATIGPGLAHQVEHGDEDADPTLVVEPSETATRGLM